MCPNVTFLHRAQVIFPMDFFADFEFFLFFQKMSAGTYRMDAVFFAKLYFDTAKDEPINFDGFGYFDELVFFFLVYFRVLLVLRSLFRSFGVRNSLSVHLQVR